MSKASVMAGINPDEVRAILGRRGWNAPRPPEVTPKVDRIEVAEKKRKEKGSVVITVVAPAPSDAQPEFKLEPQSVYSATRSVILARLRLSRTTLMGAAEMDISLLADPLWQKSMENNALLIKRYS